MYISSVKIKIILAKQQMSLRQFCKTSNVFWAQNTITSWQRQQRKKGEYEKKS